MYNYGTEILEWYFKKKKKRISSVYIIHVY